MEGATAREGATAMEGGTMGPDREPGPMARTALGVVLGGVLGVALGLGVPAPASAQSAGFGLGGGPSFPLGGLGDEVNRGFNATAMAHFAAPLLPARAQAELLVQQLPDPEEGNYREVALLMSLRVGSQVAPGPYLLLGTGAYRGSFSREVPRFSDGVFLRTGWHVGAGYAVNLPGLSAYVESRLVARSSGDGRLRALPLTFGLLF